MSDMKRIFGHLYSANKRTDGIHSTEAIFKQYIAIEDHFSLTVYVGRHDGPIKFKSNKGATIDEYDRALEVLKDLSSGEKIIIYWTQGVDIHLPKWRFYKIERI
jgi:hypothetical protein